MSYDAVGEYFSRGRSLARVYDDINMPDVIVTLKLRKHDAAEKVKFVAKKAYWGDKRVLALGTVAGEAKHLQLKEDGTAELDGETFDAAKVRIARGEDGDRTTMTYFV